ncbi:uncharacterized protein LOC116294112 isoform X2 [Actinia tenebrosa]|uniref:Uncharacterized protein LOC116294112 isoform X2 n=1 Tax=Actinia tenebrosa TaxID=6105 RepID=A0A6P8HY19_ACTTE|nr:uncharacterized protein LOC116294112 isoform X2 [Actinia tenebrosa]
MIRLNQRGGLYKGTTGDGNSSAYNQMCPAKVKIISEDLKRTMYRNGVEAIEPSQFPRNSLSSMRLLAAASQYSPQTCINLTHWLYRAFWVHDKDVAKLDVLEEGVSSVGWDVNVNETINGVGKEILWKNVNEALDRGAFGVPSFWVNNKLLYGVDHLHMLEHELGNPSAAPLRLASPPAHPTNTKLTIYHDFASPWSYLGSTQITQLLKSVYPVQVEVEWVPIVLGALFKTIGTPVVPMQAVSEAKRNYGVQDLKDWLKYKKVELNWTSHFPLRTILPLRVSLVDGDDRLRQVIYEAGWRYDKNIGEKKVLREVLLDAGFNADHLIEQTQRQDIKDKLRANTERAVKNGVCGVPSYQVNDGAILWGQDRLNIVADLLCGWKDFTQAAVSSKL